MALTFIWSRRQAVSGARYRTREPREAETMLAALSWRRVTWRQGTKALSQRALRQPGSGWVMVQSGETTAICRVTRSGWWASGAQAGSASTTPPTCSRAPRCARLPPHQGPLGVRAGAPAAEAGTRAGALRRPILDRSASTRADDLHGLRLAAACSPRRAPLGEAGEKCPVAFRDRHHHPACRRCAARS
jgi:hypothetical protein